MSDLVNRAKKLIRSHPKQAEQGLKHARDKLDEHTGHRYDKQIDEGMQAAEKQLHDEGDKK